MSRLRLLLTMTAALFTTTIAIAADTPGTSSAAASAPKTLAYTRIYSDKDGVSHFAEEKVTLQRNDKSPLAMAALGKPLEAAFGLLAAGSFEDWHRAPRRQFMIIIKGTSEVHTSDGQMRQFPVGSVILMDDTTGKGHTTRAIGKEDHVAVVIPVAE